MDRICQTTRDLITSHPIGTIVFTVLLARFLFFLLFPSALTPGGDFLFYDFLAQTFAEGGGFGGLQRVQPGWPGVLGVLYLFVGSSIAWIVALQLALGALLSVGVYYLSMSVYRDETAALLAGIITAVWPMLVIASGVFGSETLLYATLLVFGAYYMLRWVETESIFYASFAGLLFGFAVWTDVVALALPVVLLVTSVWWIQYRQHRHLTRLVAPTVFILVIVAVVGSWVYRNHVVLHPDVQVDTSTERFLDPQKKGGSVVFAKGVEHNLANSSFWRDISHLSTERVIEIGTGLYRLLVFPHNLNVPALGSGGISYKQAVLGFLSGDSLPERFQWRTFAAKTVLTLLHLAVLVGGLWGAWRKRDTLLATLFFVTFLYTIAAVMSFGISRDYPYLGTTAVSRFILPLTPFFIVFAVRLLPWFFKGRQNSYISVNSIHR